MPNTRSTIFSTITFAALSILSAVSSAHHSRAHFGEEVVEMAAEIVEIDWRNPHVTFTMRATNDAGEVEFWELEGGSTYMLNRYEGLGRALFNVGDQVRIAGPVSTIRPNEMLITNMLLPDGTEAVMLPNRPKRWEGGIEGAELALQINNEARSLFHVWSINPNAEGDTSAAPLLTPTAEAKLADYDVERDDPALRCIKPGMPSTMSNPHPMQFVDNGDHITLNIQENDVVRVIWIGDNAAAASAAPSPLGYSVGHWEDKTLVVRTTNISWPWFNREGIPLSRDAVVDERFEISENGSYLVIHVTTTDPTHFVDPVTTLRNYALFGEEVHEYNCVRR